MIHQNLQTKTNIPLEPYRTYRLESISPLEPYKPIGPINFNLIEQ